MDFNNQALRFSSENNGNSSESNHKKSPTSEDPRLSQLLDSYKTDKKLAGRSPRTIEQYEYVISRFGEHLGENPLIREIDKALIRKYLSSMMNEVKVTTVG